MYPCNPDYLLAGSTIASNQRNLFNSHEDFTSIEPKGIERLHAYLSQWDDVTIVVYYRHYFSYVGSRYNQRMKNNSIKRGHYEALQDYIALDSYGTQRYTKELVERLRAKFTDVVVVNMHDTSQGDPAESFFCHALSTFPQTCAAIRPNETKFHMNPSVNLHPVHLMAGAFKAGLLSQAKAGNSTLRKVVGKKVEIVESSSTNGGKMKLKCLPSETLDRLWQRSLEYNSFLFPEGLSGGNPKEEEEMKAEFDLAVKSSLCSVDVDDALSQKDWQDFFISL